MGVSAPLELLPQQVTVPVLRRPQERLPPASTSVKLLAPLGTMVWPCTLWPQQETVLSSLSAQVWALPAETLSAAAGVQLCVPVPLVTVQVRLFSTQVAVSRW